MRDLYSEQLALQNDGVPCAHCGSHSGHYSTCGLLNRQSGEIARAEAKTDAFFLRSLRIQPIE